MADASKTYVYVFDNYVVQLVDGIDAGAHKHGAYQLSISLDGRTHKVGPSTDDRRAALGHLTAPNTPHSLDSRSGQQVLFWIAPESTLARDLGSRYLDNSGFGVVPDEVVGRLNTDDLRPAITEGWSGRQIGPLCDALLDALADASPGSSPHLHPSIGEAVRIIHEQPRYTIAADDLARQVGLSTSRFLHLFKEQMGTPLRPHLQWLRLTDALYRIARPHRPDSPTEPTSPAR
jgi:AraC-like DNA-binding protein